MGKPTDLDRPILPKRDPFQTARTRDGSILLDRVPERIPAHIRQKLMKGDLNGDGVLTVFEERALYPEMTEETASEREKSSLSAELLDAIRADRAVRAVDSIRTIRSFVFSEKAKQTRFIASATEEKPKDTAHKTIENDAKNAMVVPAGIDPELHRKGMAAYRAGMGTPMGMGETFTGTDAVTPPDDLAEGRWFDANHPSAAEAVLGRQAAERFGAKPNDRLWILTKTGEFQLTVVGILDSENESGFFVPMGMANQIAPEAKTIDGVGIELVKSADADEFKARWEKKLAKEASGMTLWTTADAARRLAEEKEESSSFRLQAATGSLLAILASVMIIFTALSIGVEEQRREIALLRAIGLSRGQVATSVLTESLLLAIPGWLGGLLTGWVILLAVGGKWVGLNFSTVGFSFLCAVGGSVVAALVPMIKAGRVRPLELVAETPLDSNRSFFGRIGRSRIVPLLGLALIGLDLWLVYFLQAETAVRASLHSGIGTLALVFGVLCLIPTLVRLAETVFLPILATFGRFDRTVSARELSANIGRTTGVAAMMAVGGGLFVLTQIWGYSMLGPFLPNRQMPDAFVAFLPTGLKEEAVGELKKLPQINAERIEPVAVEQAALAPGTIPAEKSSPFANVVFFGMDVDQAFLGEKPLVSLRFLEGDSRQAFEEMKNGRGVVITDSLQTDYGLKLGDSLKVTDPKKASRTVEYPIVGVVAFNGWQWLSKTGGVRRNFGRSGGIVFASDQVVRSDFSLDDVGYFWFDLTPDADTDALETALDTLARKNLQTVTGGDESSGNAAYVKLSTRKSLLDSISRRADSVIWGLSAMPLVTLVLVSIALVAVTVNSVRTRKRLFGILRAVGVERSKLVRMILAESILLGLVAAGASLLFGLPAAAGALKLGQSLFGTADPEMILPVRGLTLGLGLLVALTIAAAIWPAIRTGRTPPLDLLREGRGDE